MDLRNLNGEELIGPWVLGIGRRGQERCQRRLPGFSLGHLVGGNAFSLGEKEFWLEYVGSQRS